MSHKYETRCWLCNNTDIEPDARGMVCRACGATYNVVAKLGIYPLTQERDYGAGGFTGSPVVSRKRSKPQESL